MKSFDLEKQAQDFYSKVPVIVLGSGASAAHGMSGMNGLAEHLIKNTDIGGLSDDESKVWSVFCNKLKAGIDLVRALHEVDVSKNLTDRIIRSTWGLINQEDRGVFYDVVNNGKDFPLTRLLDHLFRTSNKRLSIVTTNYDRLAEYACDQGGFNYFTGFKHGYLRRVARPGEFKCQKMVNIWKVHGSIDWFQSSSGDTVSISGIDKIPENYIPQIVTPGSSKYQKTHHEPFRSTISSADDAVNDANSYLCIGYGFNDEHIQPKMISKCRDRSSCITIVTRSISEMTKKLILGNSGMSYLAIERGDVDDRSVVYSSMIDTPLEVEKNIWSLEGYLSIVM